MRAEISWGGDTYEADLTAPIRIAIDHTRAEPVNAFGLPDAQVRAFRVEGFTGRVAEGGSCNVDFLALHPHGNGTHTEGVGHIDPAHTPVEGLFERYFFRALLLSCPLEGTPRQRQIAARGLQPFFDMPEAPEALVIRSLPNHPEKCATRYAGAFPPSLSPEAMRTIAGSPVRHLLVDLPSVDPEDDPRLANHHLFWEYPHAPRFDRSITELIYVPDHVKDGLYLLQMCPPPIGKTDALPNQPVLYALSSNRKSSS